VNKQHEFRIETLEGSYYEIGLAQGKKMRKNYPYLIHLWENFEFPRPTSHGIRTIASIIKEICPQVIEEMYGFAEGSEVSSDKIFVSLSGYGFKPNIFQGCSQYYIHKNKTTDSNTYAGRNYDFSDDERYSEARLLLFYPENGINHVGTSEFIFGRLEGMNENKLYAGISYAHGKGKNEKGMFFPIITRGILENCKTANEAVELIKSIEHSSSYNYLVADPEKAYVVETSPNKISVRECENDSLVCTNHYCNDEMKSEQAMLMSNSLKRYDVLKEFCYKEEKISQIDIKKILSGHKNDGVCIHYYRAMLGTLWSTIFNLDELTCLYSAGPPCSNEYFEINLKNKDKINKILKMKLKKDLLKKQFK